MPDSAAVLAPRRPLRGAEPQGACFASVACALPDTVVGNGAIAERLGVSEDWIFTRTGVRERRVLAAGESVTDLACAAGERALGAAGLDAEELGLVLVATTTPDEIAPGCGPLVAARLGATGAAGIDVSSSCTGFLAAASAAAAYVEAGRMRHVLVVGVDAPSRLVDPDDRDTAPLFGDGAGAVVVSACSGASRIGPIVLRTDGAWADCIRVGREEPYVRMQGHDTYKRAVIALSAATVAAVAAAGRTLDEIEHFVYHQANGRILTAVADRLDQPRGRFVNCIESYANTAAASIPIALAESLDDGELQPDAQVVIGACGAGFTWGAAVVEWGGPRGGDRAPA
ncbi:MAG TPA: beta-ketoacyl-ACP synthase 3 [Thermoleophilaceae bacterium]|jgi:3-oxoacyl-[acyl-carrier-protein] synthase-3